MCSLFGWIDYKGIVNSKVLNKLTQSLANAAEERGTDAAGVAYVQDGRISIYKRPKPAHKLKFKIPKDTKVLMGHTRFATQGNKEQNYNNHPFMGRADKYFALAHNGVLYNDTWLRKMRDLPETNIKTDSYVAVQIIELHKKLDFESLRYMAEDVEGTFNFTILDEDNKLYIVKGNNPLTLLHFEVLGIYIYASTDSILKKALSKSIFKNFSFEDITLHEGDILSIDEHGLTQKAFFTPYEKYTSRSYYGYGYYPWCDYDEDDVIRDLREDEVLLYEYAEKFDVDSEIISELLEFGYTPEQVEDMIYDPEELDNCLSYVREFGEYDKTRNSKDIGYYKYID